jgi:tetraacyldisaccharide 4'-kinase
MAKGTQGAVRLPVPVIVVGNITAGGTGKTPLTVALVAAMRARGWRPGVVSRGYGGAAKGPALLPDEPDPALYGDEPTLMRVAGATVAIGRDRVAAARMLMGHGCNLIIADDGLQHYRLARDIEICVIDGARRFGNQKFLPAGPLREPIQRLNAVDFRVVNGGSTHADEIDMRLLGGAAEAIGGRRETLPLSELNGKRIHAVAAIGNPYRFFAFLREKGMAVVEHAFPDHHRFEAKDFGFAHDEIVLMTSKDAVKCRPFASDNWFEVPVVAELPEYFFESIHAKLN